VENLWATRGKRAHALLKNFLRRCSKRKTQDFSADPQENPPHTTALKCKQAFVPQAFPPIHSNHHNNKRVFSKRIL
jgi:hypothetical protein